MHKHFFAASILLMISCSSNGSKELNDTNLYHITKPVTSDVAGCWANHLKGFNEVIGYSSLGHVFFRNLTTKEYIVFHPFKGASKSYGSFDSINSFEQSILQDKGFQNYVMRPQHVLAIAKRLGPLNNDEIYIPVPYPFIGGSGSAETYKKGNIWVMLQIVAEMADVCS